MAEPTLQQIFGNAVTQNATQLIISKSDLTGVGLTSSATNRAESLLVAIILKARQYLSSTNQQNNADIQVTIEDGFAAIINRNSKNYRQFTYNVNLQKIDTSTAIDPDDY